MAVQPKRPSAASKRKAPNAVSLDSITRQLRKIARMGQTHEAAAGLQAARAALMDIARLNGLEPEGPTSGAVSWEELLATIPDDDDPPKSRRTAQDAARPGGKARPPQA